MKNLLISSLKELNIDISPDEVEQFFLYKKLMLDYNSHTNLTAITDEKDIILKHFVDSLAICTEIKKLNLSNINAIDVGTGAGFPGVPIKIVMPEINLTLLDSLNKRIKFLDDLILKLNFENVSCVHSRAEDGGKNELYREQFNLCVSRAVANLSVLCEYCVPFISTGGYFIAMKGAEIDEELDAAKNAIKTLGCKVVNVSYIDIPNTDIKHSLIVMKKISNTPKIYPRKAGTASKNPL